MGNLDLIKKAYANETVQVEIDLGGGVLSVLDLADFADVYAEQSRVYDLKLAEYIEQGYGDKPINEKKWRASFERVKPEQRKKLEAEKPSSLAEQFADEDTRTIIIRDILPKYLKDKSGNPLFVSEKEQREFGRFAISTIPLQTQITEKIIELSGKLGDLRDKAKNSSKQEN